MKPDFITQTASNVAEAIIKGLIVTGFENDEGAERVIEGQRDLIEGTIKRGIKEHLGSMFGGKEIRAVFNYTPAAEPPSVRDFIIPPENEAGVEFGGWPKENSIWRHYKSGQLYMMRGRSNEDSNKKKYPPTVEYKNWRTGKHYSGRLDDWHRRMTYVGIMGRDLAKIVVPDEPEAQFVGGKFVRDGFVYTVESELSSDSDIALCSRKKVKVPRQKIYDIEGENLDNLDPAVRAFLEAVGKANGLGPLKGIILGDEHYINVSYCEASPGAYTVISVSLPKGMQLPPLRSYL